MMMAMVSSIQMSESRTIIQIFDNTKYCQTMQATNVGVSYVRWPESSVTLANTVRPESKTPVSDVLRRKWCVVELSGVTLDRYEPSHSLRSLTQHLLSVPFCNTVLGKHRFLVAAPLVWNSFPLDLRTANSLPAFKNNLKTFLFHRDFK